jgi:hypothetical protein
MKYEHYKRLEDARVTDEMVNKPAHYNQSEIECIDAIKAATGKSYEAYLQGTIIKYLWRYNHKHKDRVEDLKKAQNYLSRLIQEVTTNG